MAPETEEPGQFERNKRFILLTKAGSQQYRAHVSCSAPRVLSNSSGDSSTHHPCCGPLMEQRTKSSSQSGYSRRCRQAAIYMPALFLFEGSRGGRVWGYPWQCSCITWSGGSNQGLHMQSPCSRAVAHVLGQTLCGVGLLVIFCWAVWN